MPEPDFSVEPPTTVVVPADCVYVVAVSVLEFSTLTVPEFVSVPVNVNEPCTSRLPEFEARPLKAFPLPDTVNADGLAPNVIDAAFELTPFASEIEPPSAT